MPASTHVPGLLSKPAAGRRVAKGASRVVLAPVSPPSSSAAAQACVSRHQQLHSHSQLQPHSQSQPLASSHRHSRTLSQQHSRNTAASEGFAASKPSSRHQQHRSFSHQRRVTDDSAATSTQQSNQTPSSVSAQQRKPLHILPQAAPPPSAHQHDEPPPGEIPHYQQRNGAYQPLPLALLQSLYTTSISNSGNPIDWLLHDNQYNKNSPETWSSPAGQQTYTAPADAHVAAPADPPTVEQLLSPLPTSFSWFSTSPINTGNTWLEELLQSYPPPTTAPTNTTQFSEQPTGIPIQSSTSSAYLSSVPISSAGMSSDEDYTKFLERASGEQQQPQQSSGSGAAKTKGGFTTESVKVQRSRIPKPLLGVESEYVSDTEQAFELVAIELPEALSKKKLAADVFASVTGLDEGSVESIGAKDFDPRGEYKSVTDAVKEAAGAAPSVFRVQLSGTRCEYWVVGVDGHGLLVGLKARAVES